LGLDDASMRMGLDYGITNNLMVGIGRSTYQKAYDAFFKLKILRQSTGKTNMPITLSLCAHHCIKNISQTRPREDNLFFFQIIFQSPAHHCPEIFDQYFPAIDANICSPLTLHH
jgi:hypothetical protein